MNEIYIFLPSKKEKKNSINTHDTYYNIINHLNVLYNHVYALIIIFHSKLISLKLYACKLKQKIIIIIQTVAKYHQRIQQEPTWKQKQQSLPGFVGKVRGLPVVMMRCWLWGWGVPPETRFLLPLTLGLSDTVWCALPGNLQNTDLT